MIGVEVLSAGALHEVYVSSVIDSSSNEDLVAGGVVGVKADQNSLMGTRLEVP
jgi:hypothetical protein